MDQPIPEVSGEDITRILNRDFPEAQRQQAAEILAEYQIDELSWRVHAAILKLANGDLEKLRPLVNIALLDYRDVVATAEYPKYLKQWAESDPSPEDEERIVPEDWKQYQEWFNRL